MHPSVKLQYNGDQGFQRCSTNKVTTISTDRHPEIVKEMRVNNPEKHHQFDPWHVAKGLSKKIAKTAKAKECEGLAEWITSIINHLWCAQTCEDNAKLLREKWVSVVHHVTNRQEWPGNRYSQITNVHTSPLTKQSKKRSCG